MNHMSTKKVTVQKLITECKSRGIKGYSGLRKAELQALLEADGNTIQLIGDLIGDPIVDLIGDPVESEETSGATKKRIASLFAGCGGLDYGFFHNNAFKHVFVNEYDSDACKTYEKNFKLKPLCKDIKTVETIPDCDLLIGGFPCQGFSMANPYRSETDERNELYLEILRLLKLKSPSYFLLENVKGILNMGGYATKEDKKAGLGKIMKGILADLTDCGYKVRFKLFDIKQYGVPQKRQRVIFIGVRNDIDFEPVWPTPTNVIRTLKDAIGDLPLEHDPSIQHVGTLHKCAVTGYLGNRELAWDEPSPTITGRGGGTGGPVIHNHPSLKRRLTVRECARIQTFPDTFTFVGSTSSMYRQLGNAVPCEFAVHLAKIFESAPLDLPRG